MHAGRAVRAPSAKLRVCDPYSKADVTLGYDHRDFAVLERQQHIAVQLIRKNVGRRTKKISFIVRTRQSSVQGGVHLLLQRGNQAHIGNLHLLR
jgi:hypothetical protein